jgi:hypothetical protein
MCGKGPFLYLVGFHMESPAHVCDGLEIGAQLVRDLPFHEAARDDAAHRADEFLNPSCVRCLAHSAGSRDACRISDLALSCCGCRPLMRAVVMSDASQGRRRRL